MNSKFIDTHIHLDLVKDYEEIIRDIEKNEMYIISMTNLPALFEKNIEMIKSKKIRIALGFHPELIYQYKNQIPLMWKLLDKTKYIGEVGLDLKNRTIDEKDYQIKFFNELIEKCNYKKEKVISVHSRGSESEIISILNKNIKSKIILHWYSGNLTNLNLAINLGCYFSINTSMINTKKGQEIIKKIPNERLLTESDFPFIKSKKKLYCIEEIPEIVQNLSQIKKMTKDEMKNQIFRNFKELLREQTIT